MIFIGHHSMRTGPGLGGHMVKVLAVCLHSHSTYLFTSLHHERESSHYATAIECRDSFVSKVM